MIHDPALKKLFAEYEEAFSGLDTKRSAQFFAESFISAGPKGTIAQSKDEFIKMSEKAVEFYRSIGQESAKIITADEMPISGEYAMVNVHWGVRFQKTGDKLIEFDVSYIVQRIDGSPKIILFIAHRDEDAAMRELGLMPRQQAA